MTYIEQRSNAEEFCTKAERRLRIAKRRFRQIVENRDGGGFLFLSSANPRGIHSGTDRKAELGTLMRLRAILYGAITLLVATILYVAISQGWGHADKICVGGSVEQFFTDCSAPTLPGYRH
jgi:hypothetical protein